MTAGRPQPDGSGSLVLVGPLPPPHHGQAVSFEVLVDAVRERGIAHEVVDLAQGARASARVGIPTAARAIDYVRIFGRYFRAASGRRKTVYLTIAQSFHGFLRDAVMIAWGRLWRHRMIAHLHGGNYHHFHASCRRPARRLMRAVLRQLDGIIVLGEGLRSMFDFAPELASKIRVVPNGLPRPSPGTGIERAPIATGAPVRVLYLSNLVESKGYLDLLEAIPILRDELGVSNLVCDFCGEFYENPADDERVRSVAEAREWVGRFVERHALADRVHFHGPVGGEAKERLLARAHLFVLPTYYCNEGQPISIIEAMAHGAVVVTTAFRAIPDLVLDGVTGRFVEPRNPRSIAGAIHEIVGDPARYEAMSRAALALVRQRFTREAHVSALLAVLQPAERVALTAPR